METGKTILEGATVAEERGLQMGGVRRTERDCVDAAISGAGTTNRITSSWVAYASDLEMETAKPFSTGYTGKDDMVREIVMSFLP